MRRPGSVKPVLVLGLGNVLLRDDGFGPLLVERLVARFGEEEDVEFVDGGTIGLGLLSVMAEREAVLILDAFRTGQAPGTLVEKRQFAAEEAGPMPGRSAHEGNAAGLLAVAALTGDLPGRLAVLGVEPGEIATGMGLSTAVEAVMDEAEERAVAMMRALREERVCV